MIFSEIFLSKFFQFFQFKNETLFISVGNLETQDSGNEKLYLSGRIFYGQIFVSEFQRQVRAEMRKRPKFGMLLPPRDVRRGV